MISDPYVYKGTEVLINRFGIRDQDKLQEVENFYFWRRVKEILPHGNFDYSHLKAIHQHLLGDVYPWAGQERTVDISKGDSFFARKEFIANETNKIFSQLAKDHYLSGLERKSFVEKSAYYFNELNAAHPFREGNGRTLRAFFNLIAQRSGYGLDWSKIEADKDFYIQASIAGFNGNDQPMQAIFDKIAVPLHEMTQRYQDEVTVGLNDVREAEKKAEALEVLDQPLDLDEVALSPNELYYPQAKPIHYTLGAHYLREQQGLMGVDLSEMRFMAQLKLADDSRTSAIIVPLIRPDGEVQAECMWCLDAAGEAITQSFLRGETKGAAGVLQQGQAGDSSDVYIVSDVLEGKAIAMGDPQATILLTTARYRDVVDLKAWLDQRGVKIRSINLVVKEFNAQQVEWMLTQTAGLAAEKIDWYVVKGRNTDQGVHAALLAKEKVNISMHYTERMGLSQAAAKYLPAKQQEVSLLGGLKRLVKTPKITKITQTSQQAPKTMPAETKVIEKKSLTKSSKFYYLPDKAQRQALQDYFKACDQLPLKNDAQNSMAIAKAAQGVYAAFEKEVRVINFHAQPIKKLPAASSLETIKKRVLHHQVLGLDDLSALLNEVAQPKLDQATQMAMQGVLDITRDSERANLCFEKSAKIMAESAKLLEAWLAEPLPDNEVLFNMSSGKAIDCSRLSRGEWMGMVKGIQGFAETYERINRSPAMQHERSRGLRLQDEDSAGGMHF